MILVRESILKSDLICLAEGTTNVIFLCFYVFMFLCFYVSCSLPVFFLQASSRRKTGEHKINICMFFLSFLCFFCL